MGSISEAKLPGHCECVAVNGKVCFHPWAKNLLSVNFRVPISEFSFLVFPPLPQIIFVELYMTFSSFFLSFVLFFFFIFSLVSFFLSFFFFPLVRPSGLRECFREHPSGNDVDYQCLVCLGFCLFVCSVTEQLSYL